VWHHVKCFPSPLFVITVSLILAFLLLSCWSLSFIKVEEGEQDAFSNFVGSHLKVRGALFFCRNEATLFLLLPPPHLSIRTSPNHVFLPRRPAVTSKSDALELEVLLT
jgi:hypothetical protein